MDWLFRKITDFSDAQYNGVYSSLSRSRKAHIDSMKHQDDKYRSLLATALIDQLLKKQNVVGATLEIDSNNKPFLSGSSLYVSISHCKQGVACALSESPIGIDLEIIKPVKTALINYICTPEEKEYVFSDFKETKDQTVTQKQTLIKFFKVWTAKEAYFKKQGTKNMLAVNTLPLKKECFIEDGFLITLM